MIIPFCYLDSCTEEDNTQKKPKLSSKHAPSIDLSTLYSSIANDMKKRKSSLSKVDTNSDNEYENDTGIQMDPLKVDVQPDTEGDETAECPSSLIEPETQFAKAIIEGDIDGVLGYLKTIPSERILMPMQFDVQKLQGLSNGKSEKCL